MFTLLLASLSLPSMHLPSDLIQVRGKGFEYETSRSTGATTWRNLQSGRQLNLAGSPEVELEVGAEPKAAERVKLVSEAPPSVDAAVLLFKSLDGAISVEVRLEPDPVAPVLKKRVFVTNTSPKPLRLLNVVLGRFPLGRSKPEGGERGFPLYLDNQFFVSVAHPAGFARAESGSVILRQYPGKWLPPGETFACMEAVYGAAGRAGAKALFIQYVRSRMARVVCHHDHAYSVLESFGGQPDGDYKRNFSVGVSEAYLLHHLDEVAESNRAGDTQFDFYGMEFWHDRAGDLKTFNRKNFPNGFDAVRNRILGLGMKPALWIDSGRLPDWTIDQNPAVKGCYTIRDGVGHLCRASEPLAQMYRDAYLYQMSHNKVGLVKFDNLESVCNNPAHAHLPGPLYSTEAIYDSIIDFFQTLRAANGDLFIELYWGYHSPWWLLYGDTCFDTGGSIEAASPAQFPAPYARDSVTQRLDQAQRTVSDTPWLGKDSLGVWLSDWAWNSGIGSARWQEGVIMDMARGNLLLQLWTDADWLTPPERQQVAMFIQLLKTNPACFGSPIPILGNPDRAEPYGYRCPDGTRSFLAIDNACLKDSLVSIDFARDVGFPKDGRYDVYRWYPHPAKLATSRSAPLKLAMRPYEVDLLEVVPAGEPPSLRRRFSDEAPLSAFSEPTRPLPFSSFLDEAPPRAGIRWHAIKPTSAIANSATLTVRPDWTVLAGGPSVSGDVYTVKMQVGPGRITGLLLESLTDPSLPAGGPGRGENGNFALTNVDLSVTTPGESNPRRIKLLKAEADFEQTTYSGWPAAATIDSDTHTGWSIHPFVGQPHAICWTLAEPLEFPRGANLVVTLAHGENHHNLGRFRLSVTDLTQPTFPPAYRRARTTAAAMLPPTTHGGLLLIVGGGSADDPIAEFGGQSAKMTSVWSRDSNWDCPWSAWRVAVDPSSREREVRIHLPSMSAMASKGFKLYFLPK